jgi:xylulokinase
MTRDLVIGIDCSTTAAKAVVWDARGRAVAEGRVPIARTSPHPGWGEQDPLDWWRAVVTAIETASGQVDAGRIAALSVTHQRETFVCLDADGEAVRPAILWLDTRAADQIDTHGSARVHEVTGKPPNTTTSWYKLLWLRRHEPQVMARTRWVAEVHGYLVHRMTGRWRTSYGSVDPMGLLDMRSFALDGELLAQAGLHADQIPEIHAPGDVLGGLQDDVAARVGLTPGLPVVAGLGDGQAAGLGAGIAAPGAAYLNLGTGIVSGTFSAEYRWGHEFRTMSGAASGTYMPETFIGGGTLNVSWFVERFSDIPARPFGLDLSAEHVLEAAAAGLPAGSDGLLALPYLAGALSPYWDDTARGLFFGLSPQHGKAHLYRALLEGLAMEQRLSTTGAERALGTPIERLLAMGGGSRSPLWCQIVADVLRRPVDVTREVETTCLGAAMLAAVGVGLHANLAEAVSAMSGVRQTYRPDDATCAAYEPFYEVYLQLYPRLRETFAQLQAALKQKGRCSF